MSKSFRLIGRLCTAGLLLMSAALPAKGTQVEGLQVSLIPKSGSVSLHEPVEILLQIHNGSPTRAEMDLGRNQKGNLAFHVVQPDGMEVAAVRKGSGVGGIHFSGAISLRPGEDYRQLLLINEWYPFASVGEYTVEISLSQALPDRGLQAKALSAKAQIKVGPRDPARLAKVCSGLAAQALSFEFEVAWPAAKALSFAADEACIPHLGQVLLQSFHGKEGAIVGLAGVGNKEAITYLIDAWDGLRYDQQALAYREFSDRGTGEILLQALAAAKKTFSPMDWE